MSTKQRQVIPAAGGRQQVVWRADRRQQVVCTDSRRNQRLFPSLYRLALHGEFKIGFQIDWLYYVKLRQQCMASFTSFIPYRSPPLPSPPKLFFWPQSWIRDLQARKIPSRPLHIHGPWTACPHWSPPLPDMVILLLSGLHHKGISNGATHFGH